MQKQTNQDALYNEMRLFHGLRLGALSTDVRITSTQELVRLNGY